MSDSDKSSDAVRVVLRIRPLNPKENAQGCSICMTKSSQTQCSIDAGTQSRAFGFDRVLGKKSSQPSAFEEVIPLLKQWAEGYNATLLAYG